MPSTMPKWTVNQLNCGEYPSQEGSDELASGGLNLESIWTMSCHPVDPFLVHDKRGAKKVPAFCRNGKTAPKWAKCAVQMTVEKGLCTT